MITYYNKAAATLWGMLQSRNKLVVRFLEALKFFCSFGLTAGCSHTADGHRRLSAAWKRPRSISMECRSCVIRRLSTTQPASSSGP